MNERILQLCIAEEIIEGWRQLDNCHAHCFSGVEDIDNQLLNIRKKLLDEYNKSSDTVKAEVDRRRALVCSFPTMHAIKLMGEA